MCGRVSIYFLNFCYIRNGKSGETIAKLPCSVFCRAGRQLLALNRARVFSRFNSIDAPVKTEVQTPSRSPSAEAEGVRPVEGATQVEGLQSENTVQAEIIQVESIQTEATSQPGNNTQPILESARAAWRKKTVQSTPSVVLTCLLSCVRL